VSYVVDASVFAKLFIEEEGSDKATELMSIHVRGGLRFSAPTLVLYELGNVFWKHPQITHEKAYEFLRRFLDLQIRLVDIHSDDNLLRDTCNASRTSNLTFYDASYLAVAKNNDAKLITADEELHAKAPGTAVLLREF
jgi:predicted nucleic acid-binding protein